MTQAQIDIQNQIDLQSQLEQTTVDLTTRPLLNDSRVLYIDTSEPTPTNSLEQMEQDKIEHDTSKVPTPLNDTDNTHATPPPPKKRYEIMKYPLILHQSILLQYLPNFLSLQPVMII